MDTLRLDVRFAVRTLLRKPAFAVVALLTLALGIGANTAVFSVVDEVLLSRPGFADPDALYVLSRAWKHTEGTTHASPWSYPDFEVLESAVRSAEVAAFSARNVSMSGEGEPRRIEAEMVSPNYFTLLGLPHVLGRGLWAEAEGARPLVLSHALWRSQFGESYDVIGRIVMLDGVAFEVAGVAAEGYRGQSGRSDVWVPITDAPAVMNDPRRLTRPFANWIYVVSRIGDDASLTGVEAELNVIAGRINTLRQVSGDDEGGIRMMTLADATTEPRLRRTLLLLLGAAGLVLLIACANLASLLLARAVGRRREVAVRTALGASRIQLVRLLFTESLLVSAGGAIAALVLAGVALRLLAWVRPAEPSGFGSLYGGLDFAAVNIDGRVLAFNIAGALLASLLFGLAPALHAARIDITALLKDSPATVAGFVRSRMGGARAALVALQIAFAVILLTGAGVTIESLARLNRVDLGIRPEGVLAVGLQLPPQRYDEGAVVAFYQGLLERIRGLPSVSSAAVATSLPVSLNSGVTVVEIEGRTRREVEEGLAAGYHLVSDGYFDALGTPILRGRGFLESDRAGAPRVAVIDETAARQFFADADPIGQRIWLGAGYGPREDLAEIVGVAADVKYGGVEEPARPHAYLSSAQYMEHGAFLIVRSPRSNPASLLPSLRAEIAAVDPSLPLFDARTLEERVAAATSRTRFGATLLGVFAVLALSLAAVGAYGVASFTVAARTREIGIRRALGADDRLVVWQIVREGGLVAFTGIAVGIAGALAVARLLESQLYEVAAAEPRTIALVAIVLFAASLVATWIPSRRAALVHPLRALRD